jgi:hypothetical protein
MRAKDDFGLDAKDEGEEEEGTEKGKPNVLQNKVLNALRIKVEALEEDVQWYVLAGKNDLTIL